MENFKEAFREEAEELLNKLESILLELESDPTNTDALLSVFRTMHTIKGSAAMFGFEHISSFAHTLETCLDEVKSGETPFTARIASLTLSARDHILSLLEFDGEPDGESIGQSRTIESSFREAMQEARPATGVRSESNSDETPSSLATRQKQSMADETSQRGPLATYRIDFRPEPDIYQNGTNPLLLLAEVEEFGPFGAVPHVDSLPALSEMDPERCVISWTMFVTTHHSVDAIRDVFMFVEDSADVEVVEIENLDEIGEGAQSAYRKVGQILADRGIIDAMQAEKVAARQRRIGEELVSEGVPQSEVDAALLEQDHVRRSRERFQSELSASTIRVDSAKLDGLVDLVGELVTLQARLMSTSRSIESQELSNIAEGLERLVDTLRDSTMNIRMVPVGATFSKFRRMVRDLSESLGKKVELHTEGSETELDKTVIERLNEPLVHIVRNAIDHGIESPDERRAAGKSENGNVTLRASHQGANVVIEIVDDGAGLDPEHLRKKAKDRGIAAGESKEAALDLIFAPGFSTADEVTEVSGRGVGMDVVRRQLESLGGSVRVDSSLGTGTTFSLIIPLTLAIIDGLLVRVGPEYFVFPLSAVSECLAFEEEKIDRSQGEYINNRGSLLSYTRLRTVFSIVDEPPEHEQLVVVRGNDGDIGLVVDAVLGDHQTVIKDLGRMFRTIDGVSGATILGDGTVALVCDITQLQRVVHEHSSRVRPISAE